MTHTLRAVSALAVTSLLAATAAAQIFPTAPTSFAVGSLPHSVAIGDFNHDGLPDFVTANEGSNALYVRLGTGAGSFGTPMGYGVGSHPYAVAVGEVDGDGNPDLVCANHNSQTISVWLGSSTGSFLGYTAYPVASKPVAIAIGDLNGDGLSDLVSAGDSSDQITVLLGAGAGNFGAPTSFSLGGWAGVSIAIGDMNGDGRPDLAVMIPGIGSWDSPPTGGVVSILLGNGTGTFAAPTTYPVGGGARSLAIGDLNSDGKPDVVTANGNSSVAVLLGTGGGSLGAPTFFPAGNGPASVAIGDLDGNGILDLVTANFGWYPNPGNSVSILIGTGGGKFSAPTTIVVGSEPMSVAISDLNLDGRLDVATANLSSNSVSVLLNGLPPVTGVVAYGTGTSGCAGQLSLNAKSAATLGSTNFAIIGSNAPRNTLGSLLATDAGDAVGTDLFGVGVKMHFSLIGATQVLFSNIYSGPSGEQYAPVPVPVVPSAIGMTYYVQTLWVEPVDQRCTSGLAGLVSSNGLAVTVQP